MENKRSDSGANNQADKSTKEKERARKRGPRVGKGKTKTRIMILLRGKKNVVNSNPQKERVGQTEHVERAGRKMENGFT